MVTRRGVAEAYHAHGFNVIPTKGNKRPALNTWERWQTERQDHETLALLEWEREEVKGVAAIAGEVSGGLLALDMDGARDEESLRSLLKAVGLPESYPWIVRTPGKGGGWHIWVRATDMDGALAKAGVLRKGKLEAPWNGADCLELRWKECYTLLPPSRHPEGVYQWWANGGMPKEPPAEVSADLLLGLASWKQLEKTSVPESPDLSGHDTYIGRALESEAANVLQSPEGDRNNQLYRSSFKIATMAHAGADRGTVSEVLVNAARGAGLNDHEARRTFESGWQDGLEQPREMPERRIAKTVEPEAEPQEQESVADVVWLHQALREVHHFTKTPLPPGIPWPWSTVNSMARPMRAGSLAILAGYTSHGKTAAALECALATARMGKRVLIVSGEMRPFDIAVRVSQRFGLSSKRFFESCPDASDQDCANLASQDPVHRNIGVIYIRKMDAIRAAVDTVCPDFLIIDYLGLLDIGGLSRVEGTTRNSQALKGIALTRNIPVLCLSQFRRADRTMRETEPRLDDLRDSGSIEQDADQVVIVWRKTIEHEQLTGKPMFVGEIIVAKARMGSFGKVPYTFDPVMQRFSEDA